MSVVRVTRLPLAALLVVFGAAVGSRSALPDPPNPGSARDVVIQAADKVQVTGTYHPAAGPGGPGAVLLPMYRSERNAWDPVLEALSDRGVHVLAIDPRGHGQSAPVGKPDLVARVERRDPTVFAAMHQDAIAAVRWLVKEAGCDPKRICLVGAGVGGSVALDTAARNGAEVAGVLWITPGAKILGFDSLAQAKALPAATRLMFLAHASDSEGPRKLQGVRPDARLVVYDDARPTEAGAERAWAQGTRMFGRIPLVEQTVASWVGVATGSTTDDVVIDGIVTATGPNADPWDRAVEMGQQGGPGVVRAYRVGRRLVFGGVAKPGFTGLAFEVQTGGSEQSGGGVTTVGPPQIVGADLTTSRVTWSFGGMGSMPSFPGVDMGPMFGKTRPEFRAVTTEAGTSFEGEWTIPTFGDDSKLIRLFIGVERSPPPGPVGGGVMSHSELTVDLPSR